MNILMIAYYYPPKGGGGVQRTLKFVKHLSRMGHTVHVLTVKEASEDIENNYLEGNNVFVYRTDIKEIKSLRWILNKGSRATLGEAGINNGINIKRVIRGTAKKLILDLYNLRYIPDDKCGWISYAYEEGMEIIKNNKIDVIYTTSAPYSAHLIGQRLANKTNIKWVADFRDPWANNQFVSFNYLVRRKHIKLEAEAVKKADRVISVSRPIINDFKARYKNEPKEKFSVITNGYDEEDFSGLDLNTSMHNERFTILYNGMLYGKRSPEKILLAIDNLIKKNKIEENKIELIFQGKIGNEHLGLINYYEKLYPKIIKVLGHTFHKESLEGLCIANALLLIIDEGPGSDGIYTGKIFEYIRSGKTILGIVPDGVAKELIINTNTGYTAYPSRIDEIEGIINKAYSDYFNNNLNKIPNYNEIKKYDRENLTKKLVEVMSI